MKSDREHPDGARPAPLATAETVDWLRWLVQDLDRQSERIAVQREAMAEALARAEAEAGTDSNRATDNPSPAPRRRGGEVPESIDLTQLEVDFEGTTDLWGRVVRTAKTARDAGKDLNVSQAARLLIRCGQSESRRQNLRVAVQRAIDGHRHLFERVDDDSATYRYVGGDADKP